MKKSLQLLLLLISVGFYAQQDINLFDENGARHGPWRKVFKNTSALRYSGNFNHGKEVGEFLFYKLLSGKSVLVSSKVFNENNDLAQVKFFATNGDVIGEGQMKGKLFIGDWVYYHKNSKTIMTKEFYNLKGQLQGIKTTYFKNSKIASKLPYVNGLEEGLAESFYESGNLRNRIAYKLGQMNGLAEFYNESGELLRKGSDLKDLKHGSWFEYENQQPKIEAIYYYGKLQDNN